MSEGPAFVVDDRTSRRIPPAPGQESVWDYPRPPRLEPANRHLEVWFNGKKIAGSHRAWRVLESSHPPVYYIPPEDIRTGALPQTEHASMCEWKGTATYFDAVAGDRSAANAAWSYPDPPNEFAEIAGHVAF